MTYLEISILIGPVILALSFNETRELSAFACFIPSSDDTTYD